MMIRPFFWPFTPQPLTVYTQEYTSLEMIGALQHKINECVTAINEINKRLDSCCPIDKNSTE